MPFLVHVGDAVLAKVICWSSAISLVPPCWISGALEPTMPPHGVSTGHVALSWCWCGRAPVAPTSPGWRVHRTHAHSQMTDPAVLIHQMLN